MGSDRFERRYFPQVKEEKYVGPKATYVGSKIDDAELTLSLITTL